MTNEFMEAKELIKEALTALNNRIKPREYKKVVKTHKLGSWSATVNEITSYMEENGIPDSSEICAGDEGLEFCWEAEEKMTDEEKEKQRKKVFNTNAWRVVYKSLTENGYKRKPLENGIHDVNRLKDKYGTDDVYELFQREEWGGIAKLYLLSFKKGE